MMTMMWPLIDVTRRARKAGYAKGVPSKPFVKKNWGIAIFSFRVTGSSSGMQLEWLVFKSVMYFVCVCHALPIELEFNCSHVPYLINFILLRIFGIRGSGMSYVNVCKTACKLVMRAKSPDFFFKQLYIIRGKKRFFSQAYCAVAL